MKTVPEAGWAGIDNGRLLELAEGRFDVFITVDRNLSFQQSLPKFHIAVLVLRAPTNRLADLRRLMPRIFEVLPHHFHSYSKRSAVLLLKVRGSY